MDGIKLSFEEMVSRLDTACGMLIVAAMSDRNVLSQNPNEVAKE